MIKSIVTDIEGTTSSIQFVHQVLFPYARSHLRPFLRAQAHDARVQALINDVEALVGWDLSLDEAATVLEGWIDEDRKVTPLKTLQGMIWKTGYTSGAIRGHMYADTAPQLRRWHAEQRRLYVYSSGSVEAQQLIFGHTESGDLTPLFSGWFDTRIGGKRDAASYRRILQEIGGAPAETLFLSDVGAELDAAREAGMQTCQLLRDEQAVRAPTHRSARDFTEVPLDWQPVSNGP